MIQLIHGDCLEEIKKIPDNSVHLVLCDPPYNIGKAKWDKIDNYAEWSIQWIKECERVLTDTGSFYFSHNDPTQMVKMMQAIEEETSFLFRQLCVWVKPNFRKMAWATCGPKNKLRNWFNICEYFLYYIKDPKIDGYNTTGLDRINSNPECYKPLKEWYKAEIERIGITEKDIARKYEEETGKKPYMLRHYFKDNQFELPTQVVWESVYYPLGFRYTYEDLRKSYEDLRKSYEDLRKSYEDLRPVHRLDRAHCNIWISEQITGAESTNKNHICEKPVDILERIIRTSSRVSETVLDCFMGSGSTGVACVNTGRNFIGIENDEKSFKKAQERIGMSESGSDTERRADR